MDFSINNRVNEKTKVPRLLLVSGNGRNVGKTTLCGMIIGKMSQHMPVTAVKITDPFSKSNFHGRHEQKIPVYRETDSKEDKDTMRFLRSGAADSFLLQSNDEMLDTYWNELLKTIPENHCIICESNGLAGHVIPGLHIGIMKKESEKSFRFPPEIILPALNTEAFRLFVGKLVFQNNTWIYHQ